MIFDAILNGNATVQYKKYVRERLGVNPLAMQKSAKSAEYAE